MPFKMIIGLILATPLAIVVFAASVFIVLLPLIAAINSGNVFWIVASVVLYIGLIGVGILSEYMENSDEI